VIGGDPNEQRPDLGELHTSYGLVGVVQWSRRAPTLHRNDGTVNSSYRSSRWCCELFPTGPPYSPHAVLRAAVDSQWLGRVAIERATVQRERC
jgi:hypothetical protein